MRALVLDIETKKDFHEVGGRLGFRNLGVSVAGIYDFADNEYRAYEERELSALEDMFLATDVIIGFNSNSFDLPILQPYVARVALNTIPSIDILEDIAKYCGHRVSLNTVAIATLNAQKIGNGMQALELYRTGKIEELKRYCLHDVRLTKEIFDFGVAHGHVAIISKDGAQKHNVPVAWKEKIERHAHAPQKLF